MFMTPGLLIYQNKRLSMRVFSFLILLLSVGLINSTHAQPTEVYPGNWWVGMKMNKIQLMLHDTTALASNKVAVSLNYPGVKLLKVTRADNRNYLFIDI